LINNSFRTARIKLTVRRSIHEEMVKKSNDRVQRKNGKSTQKVADHHGNEESPVDIQVRFVSFHNVVELRT
jgi:hypothetical protein